MDTFDNEEIMCVPGSGVDPAVVISELFGGYRAEWLGERIFTLFRRPAYFIELETPRACMLVGGRGTGKTTVLRGLSYEGQYALSDKAGNVDFSQWNYFGFYHRVDTNRVAAFQGSERSEHEWVRLFSHYTNLIMCQQVVEFLLWVGEKSGACPQISSSVIDKIRVSLHIQDQCNGVDGLYDCIEMALITFESFINNSTNRDLPDLSIQGGPVDILMRYVSEMPEFAGKFFFFILDEYENFLEYQQKAINTLIKQAGKYYTFKVGVRELGIKCTTTLNPNEQLISPADYVLISISEKLKGSVFKEFAEGVCNDRLRCMSVQNSDIVHLLPTLSEDEEARLLGIQALVDRAKAMVTRKDTLEKLNNTPGLMVYLVQKWADKKRVSFGRMFDDYLRNPSTWDRRLVNYKHGLLYSIRRDVAGRGISGRLKYFAGWDVYVQLAAGNIRYLMLLVVTALNMHLEKGHSVDTPVSYELQTRAAEEVGNTNLSELEGLSIYGGKLVRLLLGLGRVFNIMARDTVGHAPEVTQFYFSDPPDDEAEKILRSAVMHLAVVRYAGSKPYYDTDTKDYDYALHPIYAPFFTYSYRRKRKMKLTSQDVLGLVSPRYRDQIDEVLKRNNRAAGNTEDTSDQLGLFKEYFDDAE